MTIEPRDFLRLASQLLNDPSEVAQRSAASRAYYGAFHIATKIQVHHKILSAEKKANAGVHENLIISLERCGVVPRQTEVKIQTLGTMLRQCRDLRTEADYFLNDDFPTAKATNTMSLSRRIEKFAEDLLK